LSHILNIRIIPGRYAVSRLETDAEIPNWLSGPGFKAVVHSDDETTLVCLEDRVPKDVQAETGWACLRTIGPFPFNASGIVQSLITPLSSNGIGVFVVCTFDGEHVLIPASDLEAAERFFEEQVTYATGNEPLWITVCHCRFCQRATGSDRMIQTVFEKTDLSFSGATPATYTQPPDGSGKAINVHVCPLCGTKLALTFERWPDKIGVYVGTLDDTSALKTEPENCKHIFVSEAPSGTILPAGIKVFDRHAAEADGTLIEPTIHSKPVST